MKRFDTALILDNDAISLYLGEVLLKQMNVAKEVIAVSKGFEAMEVINKFSKKNKMENLLLLLDINMPAYDGFEFIDNLIAEGISIHDACIILFTGSASIADKAKAKEYNVNGYLTKPLNEEDFKELLTSMKSF